MFPLFLFSLVLVGHFITYSNFIYVSTPKFTSLHTQYCFLLCFNIDLSYRKFQTKVGDLCYIYGLFFFVRKRLVMTMGADSEMVSEALSLMFN